MLEEKKPFYELNKIYSITINPDDKHQGSLKISPVIRMKEVYDIVTRYFRDYGHDIKVILHMDISEPRKMNNNSPRIHFHGCILFSKATALLTWLLDVSYRLSKIANIDIDTINDIDKWQRYCQKYDSITGIKPYRQNLDWKNHSIENQLTAPINGD